MWCFPGSSKTCLLPFRSSAIPTYCPSTQTPAVFSGFVVPWNSSLPITLFGLKFWLEVWSCWPRAQFAVADNIAIAARIALGKILRVFINASSLGRSFLRTCQRPSRFFLGAFLEPSRYAQAMQGRASRPATDIGSNDQFKQRDIGKFNTILLNFGCGMGWAK